LENQFWNLKVFETSFSVSLNFNSKIETIKIPFDAILEFSDPSEDFVLQFELHEDELEMLLGDDDLKQDLDDEHTERDNKVISLDLFRKK
ncbi:MAG: ClpXP protease specificity-enhancing factor SspB, partial [Alphaproteobacteria bacterium]|nr:ClpXP protease specificity-enhancing factor SspB [Alphaproteobacteria bacterium]